MFGIMTRKPIQSEDLADIKLAAAAFEEMAAKGIKEGKSLADVAKQLGLEAEL